MPLISLPQADFFDSVQPLDSVLEEALALFHPASSLSTSLPSFLMWQDAYAYGLARAGKEGSFLLALYGKNVYLPLAPKPFTEKSLALAFDYMRKVNGPGAGVSRVEGLTEEQGNQAKAWGFPVRLTLTEYLYDRGALGGLHGDPYRAKRAEINHLLKGHQVVLRPYRESDLTPCGELFEIWKGQRLPSLKGEMGEKMLLSAQKAHFQVLRQAEDWGMEAWVVLVDGRLASYTVGAPLSHEVYGIYLEVADLTVKGLSAYIFASVCRQVEGYSLVNAGDAEGLPHLAESKEHWHPVRRLLIYAADPKE